MPDPLPGIASVQLLSFTDTLQEISNTFHIAKDGLSDPPDLTTLQQLADELYTWLGTSYLGTMVTNHTFQAIICKQVPDPTGATVIEEAQHVVGAVGTRSSDGSDTVPHSLCGLLQLKTPNASRRFRGHLFLPPCYGSGPLNGDALKTSSTYWTNAGTFAGKLAGGVVGSGSRWTGTHLTDWNLVIYSRAAQLAGQPSIANVSQVVRGPKVRWLRSREIGTV